MARVYNYKPSKRAAVRIAEARVRIAERNLRRLKESVELSKLFSNDDLNEVVEDVASDVFLNVLDNPEESVETYESFEDAFQGGVEDALDRYEEDEAKPDSKEYLKRAIMFKMSEAREYGDYVELFKSTEAGKEALKIFEEEE